MRITIAATLLVASACVAVDDPPPADWDPGEITTLLGDGARPSTFGVIEMGAAWDHSPTICFLPDVTAAFAALPMNHPLHDVDRDELMRRLYRFNSLLLLYAPCSTAEIRIGLEPAASPRDGWSAVGMDALGVPSTDPTMTIKLTRPVGCCGAGPEMCNALGTNPLVSDRVAFEHLFLHQLGHALGLRHEQAHEGTTCLDDELQDAGPFDGQSVFTYDALSIMDGCSVTAHPTDGDIRMMGTLYPTAVVLFTGTNYTADIDDPAVPLLLGPGYYTASDTPTLPFVESIVVPPGYDARICTASSCAITGSDRDLGAFNNAIANILITPSVIGFDDPGFQGVSQVFHGTADLPFGAMGNDVLSSVLPGPTRAVSLCTDRAGTGTCTAPIAGGGRPDGVTVPANVYGAISHVAITKRVVTYADQFNGAAHALGVGVYKANTAAGAFLPAVRSIAISGLEVRACTEVGIPTPVSPGGAGDCRVYTQSVWLDRLRPVHGPIRFLHVREPQVVFP